VYDLNFFSTLKKQKQKSNTLKIVGISVLTILLLINAVLFGTSFLLFNKLQTRINNNLAYLDSSPTKEKLREVDKANKEVTIASEYLTIVKKTATQIDQSKLITVDLLDYVRKLAPASTSFINAQYLGPVVTLDCISINVTDPINLYHLMLLDEHFVDVQMSGFTTNPNEGTVTFSIRLILKVGDPS